MRIDAPTVLAAVAISVTLMRAGIETQAGEPQALGYPWWTFLVAALAYGLVAMWALANEARLVLLVASLIPFAFSLLHGSELRSGNATVWAAFLSGGASALAQGWALWARA